MKYGLCTTGSIGNSQSLNRYAYCQGNPVNYLDPFGLAPQSFGSWIGHTILNVLSFIPLYGDLADAFNAVWYAVEGNYAEAAACAVGAIPMIGNLATGFKIGSSTVRVCNIISNSGKAAIGFYSGVRNVMNIDGMIRSGTGSWYDYVSEGVQFGLNMFVSAAGVSGAWNGIGRLIDEFNYNKMKNLATEISWSDIDGGEVLDGILGERHKYTRTSWQPVKFDLQFFASSKSGSGTLGNGIPNNPQTVRRFMSKQEYKQFKKDGFVFNPNDSRGGISSTSTKIRPENPDMIKKSTGALGADYYVDIDVSNKNIFFKGITKGGVLDWKIQDNVDVGDIINSGKVKK